MAVEAQNNLEYSRAACEWEAHMCVAGNTDAILRNSRREFYTSIYRITHTHTYIYSTYTHKDTHIQTPIHYVLLFGSFTVRLQADRLVSISTVETSDNQK